MYRALNSPRTFPIFETIAWPSKPAGARGVPKAPFISQYVSRCGYTIDGVSNHRNGSGSKAVFAPDGCKRLGKAVVA